MLNRTSALVALIVIAAITLPAHAAPCHDIGYKSENNNKKAKFVVWVRDQTSEPDWIYVKQGREKAMRSTYSKAIETVFNKKGREVHTLKMKRASLTPEDEIRCDFAFDIAEHGKAFGAEDISCSLKNGAAVDYAKIKCQRSYSFQSNMMKMKLTILDK